eukprot:GHVU01110916.1.p1 GENE.GHVU01110916.1~~GHVU01110916.1.p1  ORF type:complete len:121 (+),score=7.71 GHVU01110916.1:402-764(+)
MLHRPNNQSDTTCRPTNNHTHTHIYIYLSVYGGAIPELGSPTGTAPTTEHTDGANYRQTEQTGTYAVALWVSLARTTDDRNDFRNDHGAQTRLEEPRLIVEYTRTERVNRKTAMMSEPLR